jgi:hypothetical protein
MVRIVRRAVFVPQFERTRVLLAEVLIVRQQLPEQIRHAAHARLSQNLPECLTLGNEFEELGLEVSYLLIRESSASPALVLFFRSALLSHLNQEYNPAFEG